MLYVQTSVLYCVYNGLIVKLLNTYVFWPLVGMMLKCSKLVISIIFIAIFLVAIWLQTVNTFVTRCEYMIFMLQFEWEI